MTALRHDGPDLLLACRIQPHARQNTFGEVRSAEVIIKLHARPVDGKANDALLRFIAHAFAVPLRRVSIERGERSRHKVLRIEGVRVIPQQLSGLAPDVET